MIMEKQRIKDFPFYCFKHLSRFERIKHFVSSEVGNIGFSASEADETVRLNRCRLAEAVGFDVHHLITAQQVHSATVKVVTEQDAGRGALEKESRIPMCDALVTNRRGICLMVLSADCVPVLLYDPERQVIAAVHAGWRGTVTGIVRKTVAVMAERFACRSADLLAGIAPSIGPCCFEVGEEVARVFGEMFPADPEIVRQGKCMGKFQVDLWEANRRELLESGVRDEQIEIAGMCTVCRPEHFFSYRRDGELAGRFGAGIMLL